MRAATNPTTIAVVARSGLFRAGLASLLERSGLGPIVEAEALQTLAPRLRDAALPAPGLLLVEATAGTAGFVCGDARRLFPAIRLVAICDDFDLESMRHCLAVGVDGYLLKHIDPDAFADSLRRVQAGEKVFPSRFASAVAAPPGPTAPPPEARENAPGRILSEREREVLRCVATGDSNKLIARRLGIAEATVKVHLKAVLRKLGAANRTQAAVFALGGGRQPAWRSRPSPGPLRVISILALDDDPLVAAQGPAAREREVERAR